MGKNLIKTGLFVAGLTGTIVSSYGLNGIFNYSGRTDKSNRYFQMQEINKTLEYAVSQSHDINFGVDDLKMRESLSDAHVIARQQFNQLAENQEIKDYLNNLSSLDRNNLISIAGLGLLFSSIWVGVELRLYNENKRLLEETKLGSSVT